ncbi:MAG TPA: prolipoprotein diacylglyceryl transferase [Chitinophagaceae bacterium]|nr:prolipoprotein diacylglyceryl transferase [Chitinophagaceae bacterium]HMZ45263.1 prolipoprotein diacylglyceryl transferase [Chitinophagaceae bacterium]HNE93044.1 prolipoprotein diacylglyceryl transferase [Chitinophagaceae bacterium]HNL82967.1 prolipoprotein diacylglyceryl transferase [Chitinophagaceae bacterium]HNM35169.1 prolipoprotein diacylglyceryl transferase [Chitinophagaceae bacterium]
MYPNLYYFFKEVFGIEIEGFKIINSFGFFVAIAFIGAAWALTQELKRKQKQGLFVYTEEEIIVGKPASASELMIHFFLGFIFGFKILGGFFLPNAFSDPQLYIFSGQGNWWMGLLVGGVFAWIKYNEKNKLKLPTPEKRTIRIWPHDRVGDLVIYAAIFGFAGAKLFDILEAPSAFFSMFKAVKEGKQDVGSLLFSGLTFYGGLIVATIAIIVYAKKHKIGIIYLADAFAPAMMLAYALGRIGCQVAGDGDWGIVNSAFISNNIGESILATPEQFTNALHTHSAYLSSKFGTIEQMHHMSIQPFLGLPNWMFGYTYPHNVVGDGVALANCSGVHCNYLPLPVFPTPFYELTACLILFLILWAVRSKLKIPGQLAGLYLIFNGTERFFIEKIRVNATYNLAGMKITQAEIISLILVIAGVVLLTMSKKWFGKLAK